MATKNSSNQIVVKGASGALDRLTHQIASQIGVTPPASGYWGDMSARQCGAVGGNMVKYMIQMAENQIAGGAGFTAGTTSFTGTNFAGTGASGTAKR